MIGFVTDTAGDWVALLSCGHRQHVRHDPPLVEREWVTTEAGRNGRVGQRLNCGRCDAFELPVDVVPYKRTDDFTEISVPAALRRDHATKTGVWARIVVLDGTLRCHVESLGRTFELSAAHPGVVVPEVRHHVEPIGPVRFFVEFLKAPAAAA